MGSDKQSKLKKLLKAIPGMRGQDVAEDEGNSYEFQATIGQKGDSLGITFNSVAQALARIKKGMKARVILVREPGSSIFTARIQFLQEEKEDHS